MRFLLSAIFIFISLEVSANKLPLPLKDTDYRFVDENEAKLGQLLFYDPILSHNNSISCASCHSPYNAFSHSDHALSHGINDQIGTRNAPTLFNLAWQKDFMWDGAVNHLDFQPLSPISHPKEMNENFKNIYSFIFCYKLF